MAAGSLISDLVDPLSALNGPLLFPRAVRVSVGDSVPIDSGNLDSINEFMKSRVLRSPEKLMIEVKRIVESRTAILDSNLASFANNINVSGAVSKKDKDMPRERRQGLGLARKRAPFNLKTSLSQPVSTEPPLNFDKLQDPDEFFDAYERHEKAKKEIQKQLGSTMDNVNGFKPSTKARIRRQGILGKSYTYRHNYSAVSYETDMLIPSKEVVEQQVPRVPRDEQAEKSITLDSNLNIDLEEIESVASTRKKEIEVNSMLDDLLSYDHEDLDGDRALNILQERLNIKPMDLENLGIPEPHDFPRTNKFSVRESVQTAHKPSFVIDHMLRNINGTQSIDHEHTSNNLVNPVASPTPAGSPFASLSFLKRILLSNPLRDAFSPPNVDLSARETAHPVESVDILGKQVNETTISRISSELESCVGVEGRESLDSGKDPQKVVRCSDNLPYQFISENSNMQSEKTGSGPIEVPEDNNIEETVGIEQLKYSQSNPSVLEDEGTEASAWRHNFDIEQQPKVHLTKLRRRKRETGDERLQNLHPLRKRETSDEHLRKLHPLRKSLAESGTSFENGVRRSKRIKMRPLEYWRGERFLYGRVNDSLKLIAVKYISPGKNVTEMKVKPLNLPNSSVYEELHELAAQY